MIEEGALGESSSGKAHPEEVDATDERQMNPGKP